MPDVLSVVLPGTPGAPVAVLTRLIAALVLGATVAFIYRRTRPASEVIPSFTVTLVLLSVLIAMVTQVIGDNVARAFSLVGALSIVRFRTVVRDTQDTAFVIFSVAVGMAVGSSHPSVAVSGIVVVGLAAAVMSRHHAIDGADQYLLQVRVGVGNDADALLGEALTTHLRGRRLVSMSTARQGMALEVSYRAALKTERSAAELVKALNRLEGVQSVTLQQDVAAEI
jgi:hypothetical protein